MTKKNIFCTNIAKRVNDLSKFWPLYQHGNSIRCVCRNNRKSAFGVKKESLQGNNPQKHYKVFLFPCLSMVYTVSAFGFEIAPDLQEQLDVLRSERIDYVEFRGAYDRWLLDFNKTEIREISHLIKENGIRVS